MAAGDAQEVQFSRVAAPGRRRVGHHAQVRARNDEGGHAVSRVEADLGSLDSVRSASTEIRDRLDRGELPPLRGFVGNAGRIVITVSDTHFGDFKHNMGMVPGPAWRSPEILARTGAFPRPQTTTAGCTAYSMSKLAAIHLVHEYARRLPAGIDTVAYNPGFVPGTGLARDAGPVSRFAMRRILPAMTLTPFATSRGAAGRHLADVVLGTTEAPDGSYVDRGRTARSSEESYDPQRERELWAGAERFTAAHPAADAHRRGSRLATGGPGPAVLGPRK